MKQLIIPDTHAHGCERTRLYYAFTTLRPQMKRRANATNALLGEDQDRAEKKKTKKPAWSGGKAWMDGRRKKAAEQAAKV